MVGLSWVVWGVDDVGSALVGWRAYGGVFVVGPWTAGVCCCWLCIGLKVIGLLYLVLGLWWLCNLPW